MSPRGNTSPRHDAVKRASAHSPFLRETIEALPEVLDCFASDGAEAAVSLALEARHPEVETELRRQRLGLALAVALGDLAGPLPLERVTGILSDFADLAISRALAHAIRERVPDAGAEGFAVIAMGKLGSRELNYSSDVDLMFLFDPKRLAKRERDDAGEASVRVGRRLIEILQRRTADGYVAR